MADADIPAELLCPICRTILKNAVQLPCCSTCACRTCALKKLMVSINCLKHKILKLVTLFKTSKKKCWVSLSDSCLNAISLDQLTPADEVRRLVEDFKGGGTLYKEKNNLSQEVPVVDDPAEESVLDPAIIVKQEPVDFPSSEVIFSSDSSLAAKIAEKSAELRARLAQCKLSGGADVGGEVSEKAEFRTENEQDTINDNKKEDAFRCNKDCETIEEEYQKKSMEKSDIIPECEQEYRESSFTTESMETSQNDPEYDGEEYGESNPSKKSKSAISFSFRCDTYIYIFYTI